MHSCRQFENELVDLLFDDMDAERKRRILSESEDCAACAGQYHSLSDTLTVFERTAEARHPPESYWPYYNATLRDRLHAPAQVLKTDENVRASFWKRLLTAKLPIPVPVAAALAIGLVVSSALALKSAPAPPTIAAPLAPPVETVKYVEVPVVQEKIVTRTVYVERNRATNRSERAPLAVAANANEANETAVINSPHESETGFFTRANLKGFQPPDEMKIRVIKRNGTDEK